MKRKLIPVVSVIAVALAALVALSGSASANKARHDGFFGGGFFAQTVVKGTVVSVDASAGTFTATLDVVRDAPGRGEGFGVGGGRFFGGVGQDRNLQGWGPGFRGSNGFRDHGGFGGQGDQGGQFHNDQMSTTPSTTPTPPAPTPVTITTNSSTKFDVNGNTSATIATLAAGDRFIALFAPTPPTSMTGTTTTSTMTTPTPSPTGDSDGDGDGGGGWSHHGHHDGFFGMPSVPTTPAIAVIAEAPPERFAFIGTVSTAPTAIPGSLGVNVSASSPTGLFSGTQTFMIGADTNVFSFGGTPGSMMGSTPTIAAGDIVLGVEIGTAGETAAQVEASPLSFVLDFPAMAPASTSPTTPSSMPAAATTMTKRLMKSESFNRALKRLMRHHRKAKRAHHARHHAKHR